MDTNELIIFSVIGLVIPIVYAKLIKSSTATRSDNYILIILTSILGGSYSYFNDGDVALAAFPFLAMIISLIAFLVPSWSAAKTFKKTLTVMMGLIIFVVIGKIFIIW